MAKEALSDDELLTILRKEEAAARLYQDGTLSPIRTEAFDYYDRLPFGDEQEGSSSVVTSEFADAVESIMPGLMEVFAGSDQVVQFIPLRPGDEQHTEAAAEYCGHVFMQRNKGFLKLHAAIKDGLMHRLGAINVDVKDEEETRTVPVQGLTQAALDVLIAEAKANDTDMVAELTPDAAAQPADVMGGLPVEQTFSGQITVTRKTQCVEACVIAPEDVRFNPTARDQDECSYIGYARRVTASELREMGLSDEDITELGVSDPPTAEDSQRTDGAGFLSRTDDQDSEAQYWVTVCFVKADSNGDGQSETLRVVFAHAGGTAGRIIEREEWEGPATIALATPILMPHSIVGRSIYDQAKDLQQVKTAVTRGMLDNLYVANRPRPAVSDSVVLDSVLDWVPGSPIRFKAGAKPGDGHIAWQTVPNVMPSALQALEYFNTVAENRMGTSRANQGLQADSINKTKGGLGMLMSAAAQRQKLIARVLAETFVARVYRLVYAAVKKAAKGPTSYWAGQQFKQVDPTKWPDAMDVNVNVGLGTGNTEQELQYLTMLEMLMEKLIQMQGGPTGPFVTPTNIANFTQKVAERMGFKTPGLFFQPAEAVEQGMAMKAQQPPPPNPAIQVEQAKAQGEIEVQKAQLAGDLQKIQAEQQAAAGKMQADYALKSMEMEIKRAELALKQQELELKARDLEARRTENAVKAMQDQQAAQDKMAADERTHARTLEVAGHGPGFAQMHGGMTSLAEAIKAQGEQFQNGMSQLAQAMMSEQEIVRDPKTGRVAGARRRPPNGAN